MKEEEIKKQIAKLKDVTMGKWIKMSQKIQAEFGNVLIFPKFTCLHCGARQTSVTANVLFTKGYECEECKKVSYPKKFGCAIVINPPSNLVNANVEKIKEAMKEK